MSLYGCFAEASSSRGKAIVKKSAEITQGVAIMVIFLLALIGTLIVMAILTIGRLGFGRREAFNRGKFTRWFIIFAIINYLICLFILYTSEPALTGPFWGWQWVLWPLVISSVANLFAFARSAVSVLEDASAISQGKPRSARSTSTTIPANASRGAIAAGILGLVVAAVVGIVISGLIVVFTTWFDSNAKALAAIPQVHMEPNSANLPPTDPNHIVLVSESIAAYKGKQVDPTLELDDNFHPYWTISLMQPSRGYTGDVLSQVLLVDAHTGDIKAYNPQDVPSWVDRVMPADTVSQYLQWWGLYHAAPWFNPSGMGQQAPASDPELLYNSVDQPVWLVPMTSSSSNDQSSTGVFLFDTHKNEAFFYPLNGLGIGSNVESTFQSTSKNIRNYSVASTRLYQIDQEPTWVAIYVQGGGNGGFQAVGIVDARNLNGSNVQYEPSLSQALTDYQQWLQQQGNGNPTSGGGNNTLQTVTGKVLRVSSVQQGNNTIYYLQLQGQSVIFTANLSLSPKLPLVQPGDIIKGEYLNTGGTVIDFKTFDDLTINLGGTPTPGATPSPTPKH